LVEEVLVRRTDEFQKGPALRIYSRPMLGNGILTSEGETHRKHRRLVAPAFAHQRVSRYADVMSAMARETCDEWTDGGAISIHREMTRLTLGIVGRTLFDADLLHDADEIGKRITELIRYATDQTRSFRPVPLEKDTPRNRRALASVEKLNQTMYGMIEQRRASGEDKGDLLSMLLLARDEDGGSLSDEQVRDEAMTLFVAGHETTANATTWSLYLLARNPEIQTALREQVRAAVGMRAITFADLPKIPLALEIFKESMRLYPPAYIVVREPVEDLEVGDGIKVRKGELIAMCEWVLHRDPRYFPDPLRFDPSRFSPENEPKIPKYAYFPFGAGRRICIGNQFALMEGQIILGTVAQRCTLEMVGRKAIHGDPLMTLRPDGPIMMRVGR
jgi:cytochrome P450